MWTEKTIIKFTSKGFYKPISKQLSVQHFYFFYFVVENNLSPTITSIFTVIYIQDRNNNIDFPCYTFDCMKLNNFH